MIADLLATCAFGENVGAKSVCCTVFSMDELLEIISHNKISVHCKRPFLKFLISVYMEEKRKREGAIIEN